MKQLVTGVYEAPFASLIESQMYKESDMNRAEQIAFNDDFNRVFAAEHRSAARDVAIEDEVAELLKEGGECYPFSPVNMFEALTQISDGKQNVIAAFFATAHECQGKNDFANGGLYLTVRFMVDEYWKASARTIAAKNVDARLS